MSFMFLIHFIKSIKNLLISLKKNFYTYLADSYLRNRMIDEFKQLVKVQINYYPDEKKDMLKVQRFLINNIDGIINQKHPFYKCPYSMEGHFSNKYAKYMTSRPHAYSENGLENINQLLTMKANNNKLTEEIYYNFKHGKSTYKQLNLEKVITNFRLQANQDIDETLRYYKLDYILSNRI